jgi:histidine decarboxylase
VEYVGSLDSTVSGSRNGFTPILLWYAIKKYGFNGFKKIVRRCIRVSKYAVKTMNEAGINAWRNDLAITVVFPRPKESICRKWKLAAQDDIAHAICMPQVTTDVIDELITDIKK